VRKIFHTVLLKSHLEKDSAISAHRSNKCNSRKTFCCYNCLDLYHAQSFSKCLFLVFPVLSSRNSVSKRNSRPTASNLHNLFSTQYSCSQELGKKWLSLGKTFLTANLDNYSNKILLLKELCRYLYIILSKRNFWSICDLHRKSPTVS
jgi:hypothetical protein